MFLLVGVVLEDVHSLHALASNVALGYEISVSKELSETYRHMFSSRGLHTGMPLRCAKSLASTSGVTRMDSHLVWSATTWQLVVIVSPVL